MKQNNNDRYVSQIISQIIVQRRKEGGINRWNRQAEVLNNLFERISVLPSPRKEAAFVRGCLGMLEQEHSKKLAA